jgi:hypothetical protein
MQLWLTVCHIYQVTLSAVASIAQRQPGITLLLVEKTDAPVGEGPCLPAAPAAGPALPGQSKLIYHAGLRYGISFTTGGPDSTYLDSRQYPLD